MLKLNYINKMTNNNNLSNKTKISGITNKIEKDFFRNVLGKELSREVIFPLPVGITDALNIVSNYIKVLESKRAFEFCNADPKLMQRLNQHKQDLNSQNIIVTKLLGWGDNCFAFETQDGNVLKLSFTDHFKHRDFCRKFDLPLLNKGKIGHTYYYIQPKANTDDISRDDVLEVIRKIKKEGYKISDLTELSTHQIGRYNGVNYLIDPECAIN